MTSLKSRLILAAAVLVTLGVVVAGLTLSALMREHIVAQFHDELKVHLDELERLSRSGPDGILRLSAPLSDPRYDVARSGFYWQIEGGRHEPARSASLGESKLVLPPDDAPDGAIHHHVIDGPTGSLLVIEQTFHQAGIDTPLRYVIGTDRRHIHAVQDRFDRMLVVALGLLALFLLAAAFALVMLALRPLSQLRTALADVRLGHEPRVQGNFPDEVHPLVEDLNAMLQTSAELMQRARSQAGKLAHALKTPLAIITDETRRGVERGDASAGLLLDQCRRMQCQIDYQMARARAVPNRSPGMVAIAANVAEDVITALRRLHQERALSIRNDVPEDLVLACDTEDLNEMLGNLVDNACKHARTTVVIDVVPNEASPGLARLVVEDDGPGLPTQAYQVVLELGERWTSSDEGAGLGLTIVRDIARLYGGDVGLGRSPLGGLRAAIDLPRASA